MAIRDRQRARNPVSIIGLTMFGPSKCFKIEVLRQLQNAILDLAFANIRAILLIFYTEVTANVDDILSRPEL